MTVSIELQMEQMGQRAKKAARVLSAAAPAAKTQALRALAALLIERQPDILKANALDVDAAKAANMDAPRLDRLTLTPRIMADMADACLHVAEMADEVGVIEQQWQRPNGLMIGKMRIPLGVIAMIFESRPNVTIDAAILCLKAGDAVILRGGKEAFRSSMCLTKIMREALASCGLPENAINLVEDTSRETATQMMKLNGYLDVLIPRGGAGLIRSVVMNATVPVIETGTGNCHIYVDASADLEMAKNILVNAKCQRPSVCNAAESLLVHRDVAVKFLPMAAEGLAGDHVTIHGCARTTEILGDAILPATDEDYGREYLGYEISCKVVDSLDEAIDHINRFNTGHSECIVTRDYDASQRFLEEVDAAAVYVNASTRFTDGFEFGFGAEIGISTQKLHARGPMGLNALTTTKYIIYGNGQVRS